VKPPSRFPALCACLAAAMMHLACEDGTPVPRGFGSVQLVSIRDPTLTFVGYGPGHALYATGNSDGTSTYWRLDVETGELRNLGPKLTTSVAPPSRYSCSQEVTDGGLVLTVMDRDTGAQTTIDQIMIIYGSSCPTEAELGLMVWRRDGAGHLTLWTGPYDQLAQVSLPVLVHAVIIQTGETQMLVAAEALETPGAIGLYTVDFTTGATSEVIPAALAGAGWALGAVPSGTLASAGLKKPSFQSSVDILQAGLSYDRMMADGDSAKFIGPYPGWSAGEFALFRMAPGEEATRLAFSEVRTAALPPAVAWHYAYGATDVFHLWHESARRLVSCPAATGLRMRGVANDDASRIAFASESKEYYEALGGSLVLVSPNGDGRDGSCTVLAENGAHDPRFSPDGSTIIWVNHLDGQDPVLWAAAADGSAPREIGRGAIEAGPHEPHFFGPSRLELRLARDLAWIDVHEDPVKMHFVAEQVFGESIDYGATVLIGYEFNDQDGTGRLGIVEREGGGKRLISTQVVTYEIVAPTNRDDSRRHVVYLVRGRNPSSQDGIWVATITADDVR
jgi:hypothetical protein